MTTYVEDILIIHTKMVCNEQNQRKKQQQINLVTIKFMYKYFEHI
jgi:hypothetical protein